MERQLSPTPALYNSSKLNHVGTWNVKRITVTVKRDEAVDVFREGKFELLALMETKLKGNGEVSGCGVSGIIAGVQEIEELWKG